MTDDEQIPLTREFTVDQGYPGRAAFALTKRFVLRRPSTWMELGLAVVGIVLGLLGVTFMWLFAGIMILFLLLIPALAFFPSRAAFAKRFPPGTVLRMGFGESRFRNEGPDFSSTVAYTFYRGAERDGEFVGLRPQRGPWSYFPGALFTDEDLARFV